MQCTYKRNIKARSRKYCCRGKAMRIAYSECVSAAVVIQHAVRMRLVLLSVTCDCTMFFPHFLAKDTTFERKKSLNVKCVFWFSLKLMSETFLILRRTERDMIKNEYCSSCKAPVIIVRY